jgi:hypothetical protein
MKITRYKGIVVQVFVLALALLPSWASEAQTFTDVTQTAGVSYDQGDVFAETTAHAPATTGGAAVGDFDGDGWEDLYVTRLLEPDILFRNLGDGTFEDVTTSAGLVQEIPTNGAGWCDVDNDGDLDLYVTGNGTYRHFLHINDGNGHFTEEAIQRNASTQTSNIHAGFSVNFGDYDRDGWIDMHTTEVQRALTLAQSHRRLLHNLGASSPGHFEDVTEAAGVMPILENYSFSSAFTDLDQDGWPDLLITSDFASSELLWNNGDGTFTEAFSASGLH